MKARLFLLAVPLLAAGSLIAVENCAPLAGAKPAEHLRSGACFASQARWREAEEQFRIYRRSNPRSATAAVSHANALVRLNRSFEGVIELRGVLESSPDSVPALKLYAALLETALNNRPQAEEVLKRCIRLAPSDPEVWQALGSLYLNQQRSKEAIRSFETAARLSPHDPLLIAGLALSYGQANHPDRAADLFTRAVEQNERATRPNALVYLGYAEYLLYQDRAADSVPMFTRALAINPHAADAYYGRAMAYEKLENWRQSEADALAAIRESEKRKDAHLLLVRIYRSIGDPEKTQQYVARLERLNEEERAWQALEQRSRSALPIYFEIVEPLLREQKCAEAIPHSLEAVELWPAFPAPLFVLGVCYAQTRQPEQAAVFLEKYLSLKPDSPEGHAALGILLFQQGRYRKAQAELERALSLDPGMLEARKALASSHLSTGNAPEAIRVLRAAGGSAPPDDEARLILAEALFRNGELASALRHANAVLNSGSANDAARKLKERILSERAARQASRQTAEIARSGRSDAPTGAADGGVVAAAARSIERKEYRQAIQTLERIVGSRPQCDPEVYVMLATCRLNLEEKSEAIQVCERALQLYPDLARLQRFYVSVLRATCANGEVKVKLRENLRHKPDSPVYLMGLGEVLFAENPNSPQLEALLSRAASALPEDPEAHYLYGQWACLNNRQEVSIRELTKALALSPANVRASMQIHTYLGIAHDRLDQPTLAESAFRKAMALNEKLRPPDPGSVMQYVDFLKNQLRQAEAQRLITQILRWAPTFGAAHLERAKFLAEQEKLEDALTEGKLALQYSEADINQQRAAHVFLAKTYFSLGRLDQAEFHQKWIRSQQRP